MSSTSILITGGGGFVGSQLAQKLASQKYSVKVADLQSQPKNWDKQIEYHQVDLRDSQTTRQLFKNIDICFNLAAKIGAVGYMYTYAGESELYGKIDRLLANPELAAQMGAAGQHAVLSAHTYEHRAKQMLGEMGL